MKTAQAWFAEYSVSHQHHINTAIHTICVPAIMWSTMALLWGVKLGGAPWLNVATIVATLAAGYYVALSRPLGLGMGVVLLGMGGLCAWLEAQAPAPLWGIGLAVFAIAWVGQFIGHHIEGKRPSFLQDLQFLLIGPLWVLAKVVGRPAG
ncbi:MAG TPA: Mpo1-like protein [Myxococcota bacterium]|nr:Mpo1-like protein [Myxococcota bacterium]